jgi:hypothetical protein
VAQQTRATLAFTTPRSVNLQQHPKSSSSSMELAMHVKQHVRHAPRLLAVSLTAHLARSSVCL